MKSAGEGNTDMKAFMSNILAEKPVLSFIL
jgi:hypothetical protein